MLMYTTRYMDYEWVSSLANQQDKLLNELAQDGWELHSITNVTANSAKTGVGLAYVFSKQAPGKRVPM